LDLIGIETGRLQHGDHHVIGTGSAWRGISAGACGTRLPRRSDCPLLRSLLDCGIDVEGSSKPDDAQQKREYQRQHKRGLGDLRTVSVYELMGDAFNVQQIEILRFAQDDKITNYKVVRWSG
jgi:hypothetical protein